MSYLWGGFTMVEGSNVIRSADLIPKAVPNASNIIQSAPATPQGIDFGQIKGIMEMVKGALDTVKEIQSMRTQAQNLIQPQQAQTDGFSGSTAPAQAPTTGNGSTPALTPQVVEKIVYKEMKIDKEKLKTFMKALLVEEASKLPDDLKEKKLSEITGENFEKLNVQVKKFGMNINANGDQILEVIVDQMIKVLPEMVEEEK